MNPIALLIREEKKFTNVQNLNAVLEKLLKLYFTCKLALHT